MKSQTAGLLTIGMLAILGWFPARAEACTCGMSGEPCQATWNADAVFAGTVRAIERIEQQELDYSYERVLVRFDVERPFVNAVAGPVEIVTGTGGGDCGYRFQADKRYLVYAWKTKSSRWSTGICSRTRPLEEAGEDLKYLNAIPPAGNGARIYGRINQVDHHPADERAVDYGPVKDILVVAQGSGFVREALTDEQGRYEITNVPVGKTTIAVHPPPEFDPRYLQYEIELKDRRACSQANFTLHHEARISGTVVDASGRPVADAEVEVVAAELAAAPRRYKYPARTDASGWFELRGLSGASYVLGVNLTRPPQQPVPFPPTFFPGTSVPNEAALIEVKPGDRKELGVLRLGERLGEHVLQGCVYWPGDQPASDVSVSLYGTGPSAAAQIGRDVRTDAAGCFSIPVLQGVRYTLKVHAWRSDESRAFGRSETTFNVTGPPSPMRLVLTVRQ
jgi:hypothetical protein